MYDVYPPVTWQWKIPDSWIMLPAINLHFLGDLQLLCLLWRYTHWYHAQVCFLIWLVVWNMNGLIFHSVGNVIIPTDFHIFSEGLKPPTSYCWYLIYRWSMFSLAMFIYWRIYAHQTRPVMFASNMCLFLCHFFTEVQAVQASDPMMKYATIGRLVVSICFNYPLVN